MFFPPPDGIWASVRLIIPDCRWGWWDRGALSWMGKDLQQSARRMEAGLQCRSRWGRREKKSLWLKLWHWRGSFLENMGINRDAFDSKEMKMGKSFRLGWNVQTNQHPDCDTFSHSATIKPWFRLQSLLLVVVILETRAQQCIAIVSILRYEHARHWYYKINNMKWQIFNRGSLVHNKRSKKNRQPV